MADFDMSYVLYGLVIAALAIIIVYFSQVEEDEPKKNNTKKQLQIEDKSEIDQLKTRLNQQIEQHDREYQQTLIQVREAENNRKIEYNKQIDNLRSIETKLLKDKDELMKEKQEFLQQKIEFQKQQLDKSTSKSKSHSSKKEKSG